MTFKFIIFTLASLFIGHPPPEANTTLPFEVVSPTGEVQQVALVDRIRMLRLLALAKDAFQRETGVREVRDPDFKLVLGADGNEYLSEEKVIDGTMTKKAELHLRRFDGGLFVEGVLKVMESQLLSEAQTEKIALEVSRQAAATVDASELQKKK